jgi:hypothetical protein
MSDPHQICLFEVERPTEVECSGSELLPLLADLKARGAVVLCMTVVCTSRYRLTLGWPRQAKNPCSVLT